MDEEGLHVPANRTKRGPACSIDGCDKPVKARTFCDPHYYRWRTYGDPLLGSEYRGPHAPKDTPCAVEGCTRTRRHLNGFCNMHHQRWIKSGDDDAGPPERVKGPDGSGCLTGEGYIKVTVGGQSYAEHRLIMEDSLGRPLKGFENVHHINGIRHDNDPSNLELWVKPQPAGQRAEDLVEWVVDNYFDLVIEMLNKKFGPKES